MAPKIIEYLGIVISFYSDEHEPIHVHANYNDYKMKVELFTKEGKISKVKYSPIKGKEEFPPAQLKELKKVINEYKEKIIQDWIDFHIMKKTKIKTIKITKRL